MKYITSLINRKGNIFPLKKTVARVAEVCMKGRGVKKNLEKKWGKGRGWCSEKNYDFFLLVYQEYKIPLVFINMS